MNREVLMLLLRQTYPDSAEEERRIVARSAGDLHDAGQFRADTERELTPQEIVDNLQDAPADHDLVERWNWWLGALELAYGGYDRFTVRHRPGVDDAEGV